MDTSTHTGAEVSRRQICPPGSCKSLEARDLWKASCQQVGRSQHLHQEFNKAGSCDRPAFPKGLRAGKHARRCDRKVSAKSLSSGRSEVSGSFDSEGETGAQREVRPFIPSGQSRLDDDSDFHHPRDYTIPHGSVSREESDPDKQDPKRRTLEAKPSRPPDPPPASGI